MTFKETLLYQFSFICLILIGLVVIFLNSNFFVPRSGILDADREIRIQERIYAKLSVLFSSQGYIGYRVDLDEGLQVGLRTRASVSPAHPVRTQARKRRVENVIREKKQGFYSLTRFQCCGSMTFWYGSGSSDPCLCQTDPGGPNTYGSCGFGTLVKSLKKVTKQ
jgi:hypothetical protein